MSHASLVLAAALVALTVAGVHARRRAALKLPRVSRRWRRELRVAATVARECGLAILDATARKEAGLAAGGVDWKDAGGIDPCTQTDRDNEARVERALRTAFPAHAIIGEEAAAAAGAIPRLGDGPTWIVDPIDGTQNFVHGLPLSVVSVGLCVARAPALGVVYNPHTDELFVGVAGEARGATARASRATARALSRARSSTPGTSARRSACGGSRPSTCGCSARTRARCAASARACTRSCSSRAAARRAS